MPGWGVRWWGTPWSYPIPPMGGYGVCPWGTPPPYTPPRHRSSRRTRCPSGPERASGLSWPRGVRVEQGSGPQGGPRLLYLRSFWPGSQIAHRAIWGNRWIGSRYQPARGRLDVSDLECLNPRCAKTDPATKEPDPSSARRIRLPSVAGSVWFHS